MKSRISYERIESIIHQSLFENGTIIKTAMDVHIKVVLKKGNCL